MLGARNYVGAVVAGAMFGAIDGVHMVMLIKVVGPDYAVWDIRVPRKRLPFTTSSLGAPSCYARVVLEGQELESIRAETVYAMCLRHLQKKTLQLP